MSSTSLSTQRIWRGLQRRWIHSRNNRRIKLMAYRVDRQARLLQKGAGAAGDSITGNNPVIFFNASTRLGGLSLNAAYSLLSSWGVQLAGVPVIHFVCQAGLSPCVLGTDRDKPDRQPPCRDCILQSRANYAGANVRWFEFHPDGELHQQLQNCDINQLMNFEYQGIPLGSLVLPSIRWILRCHHLQDDEATRYLFGQYILSAWCVAQEFQNLLAEVSPRAVVVFNGILYPEAMVRWVSRKKRIRVISHEVNMGSYSAFFTEEEATFRTMDVPEDFCLTEQQEKRLDEYLENRFSGDFKMAGVRFWPEIKQLDDTFWSKVSSYKQIVPVFTNVIFDTSQVHANSVFSDMFAWLDHVLQIMRDHPETFFIIRAHPDESRPGKASRETVEEWFGRNKLSLLPNVIFIAPDEYISSYELVRRSKFVLMYNSTIGLEATLLGVPALCAGKGHFTQIPTVYFPQTIEEYRKTLEDFLNTDEEIEVPQHFITNARRFLYYQLFLSSLPFTDFLEEDGVWQGYVRLKPFSLKKITPQQSKTINVIVEGILNEKPFLRSE